MNTRTVGAITVSALITVWSCGLTLEARQANSPGSVDRQRMQQATALQSAPKYVGPAGLNCGRWTQDRAAGKTHALDEILTWWAAGFLDGIATALGIPRSKDSADDTLAKFSDYCVSNPGAAMSEAGVHILKEMLGQTPRPQIVP
jgi:hypothetical protein